MQTQTVAELIESTASAIRAAVREAKRLHGEEALHGFALCVDNEVRSLYHVYATRDWVRAHEKDDPEIAWIATEWMQQSAESQFDIISKQLADWTEADERLALHQLAHPDRGPMLRYRAMFLALKTCHDEQLFAAGTVLIVGSVDPDPLMIEMECAAAPFLNNQANASRICRTLTG